MLGKRVLLILMALSLTVIGSGCISLLQPRSEIVREYNFIDLDAPAMRIARPVRAELLERVGDEWISVGVGTIPAGAYVKGRAPEGFRPDRSDD